MVSADICYPISVIRSAKILYRCNTICVWYLYRKLCKGQSPLKWMVEFLRRFPLLCC